MISLSECAPCKARRLQAESEREFKKRYGMVDLNRIPNRMGWRPYMGQTTATFPIAAAVSPAAQGSDYVRNAAERLLYFATGAAFAFPVGILANVAFKSLRRYRHEALTYAAMASGLGLIVALLPLERSPFMNVLARVSGVIAGSGLSDVALPLRAKDAIVAPV